MNTKQTLWTIQTEEAYSILEKTGILTGEKTKISIPEATPAYEWMIRQMRKQLPSPPVDERYPLWAWYQWEERRKRCDLRCGGYAPRGTPLVQITFEAEENDFLLSDFDDWHFVLMNTYFPDNEEDAARFETLPVSAQTKLIEPSWQKIFHLSTSIPNTRSIQATLWEIKLKQVQKVEHFIAK